MLIAGAEMVAVGRLTEPPAGTVTGVVGEALDGVSAKFSVEQPGGSPPIATVRPVTSIGACSEGGFAFRQE